jgi:hypothetical protein
VAPARWDSATSEVPDRNSAYMVLAPIHTDKVGALEPSYATLAADADPLKTWPRDLAGLWRGGIL